MHLHVGNRSLDELRCEEGYRGWLALRRLMLQIKDIQGYTVSLASMLFFISYSPGILDGANTNPYSLSGFYFEMILVEQVIIFQTSNGKTRVTLCKQIHKHSETRT